MQAAMSARLRLLEASHGRRDARDRRLATWPRPFFEGLRHSVLIVSAAHAECSRRHSRAVSIIIIIRAQCHCVSSRARVH